MKLTLRSPEIKHFSKSFFQRVSYIQNPFVFRAMRMIISTFAIITLVAMQLAFALPGEGQPLDEVDIQISLQNETLIEAFQKIQSKSPFRFMYRQHDVENIKNLNVKSKRRSVEELLKIILKGTSLEYKQLNNQILIIPEKAGISGLTSFAEIIDEQPSHANIVKGRVINIAGDPLNGVSITVKGTNIGISTDGKGEYSIDVPENGVLVFSFIGFIAQEVPVGTRKIINVEMAEDRKTMEEIVVTSFGIARDKKTLGYGVSKISGEEITNAPTPDITNALAGKVAGVQVSGSGGGFTSSNITIRGFSSITRSNQPLYVIDGVPIDNGGGSNSVNSGVANSSRVSDINPEDIESMSVLKGAAATVLYGSRAASGVILITTKKGKSGKSVVSLTSNNANLFTYAPNFPHLDPEQNLTGISNARGLEFGIQPVPRTFGATIKASF